ncbi:MAG: hypothetical protein PHE06_15575 [Lachnospiraceae bacterium]|nr:hypothetical protein [Lachnospiraceae bacterium]
MGRREAMANLIRAKKMEYDALKEFLPQGIRKELHEIKGGLADGIREVMAESLKKKQQEESKITKVEIK